jgi:hypothetical protein
LGDPKGSPIVFWQDIRADGREITTKDGFALKCRKGGLGSAYLRGKPGSTVLSVVLAIFLERGNHPGVAVTVEVNRDLLRLLHGSLIASRSRTWRLRPHSRHGVVGPIITGLPVFEVLLASKAMRYGIIAVYFDIVEVDGDLHVRHIPSLEEILGPSVFLFLIR